MRSFIVLAVALCLAAYTQALNTNETETCDFDFECATLCCEFNEDYSKSFCQEAPKVGGVCDPLLGCDCPEGHECAIDLEDGIKFTCQKEEEEVTTPAPQSLPAQTFNETDTCDFDFECDTNCCEFDEDYSKSFCQEAPKVGGVCDPLLGCDCPEGHECALDIEDGIKFTCQKEEEEATPAPQSLPAQTFNETDTCDFDFECDTNCCEFNEDYSKSFCQEAPTVGGVCDPVLGCDCPEGYDCLGDINDDGIAFTCQKEEDEVTTPAPQSLPAQTFNETNTCDFDFECETLCCEFNEDYSKSFCQEAPKVGGVCDPLLGCDCPEGHECALDLEDGIKFTCQKEEEEVTTPVPAL